VILLARSFFGCNASDQPSMPHATGGADGGGKAPSSEGGIEDGRPALGGGMSGDGGVTRMGDDASESGAGGVAGEPVVPDGAPSMGGAWGGGFGGEGQAGDGFTHPGTSMESGGAGGEEACASCHARTVSELALGAAHSCVRFLDGSLKCWGRNDAGQLGRGDTLPIGDDELPATIGSINLSHEPSVRAVTLSAGAQHTCAILSDRTLKCWGDGSHGQLGYGTTHAVGDDEQPAELGPVELSVIPDVKPYQVAAGDYHSCVLLTDDSVKCWGSNDDKALGYPAAGVIGAVDTPADWGPVQVTTKAGVKVVQLACGREHTCALLSDQSVTCWGRSSHGQLGYGNRETIGDDETPSSAGPVSVTNEPGISVTSLTARAFQTCALLSNGRLKCWGRGSDGALGDGRGEDLGDDELPSDVADVLPGNDTTLTVLQVGSGAAHGCALLSNGAIHCWGDSSLGRLGYGSASTAGGPVSLSVQPGVVARRLTIGWTHSCALLSDGSVTCWGDAADGALGYGNLALIGDDELPSAAAPVALWRTP
jgi:alpha-tubulin suppressor-like RCC1 family protein